MEPLRGSLSDCAKRVFPILHPLSPILCGCAFAADGRPPGTVSLIQPRYASDFPPSLTAHDIGLKDLLESAALLGNLPRVDLITISVGEVGELTMELSPAVGAALPEEEACVKGCLDRVAELAV